MCATQVHDLVLTSLTARGGRCVAAGGGMLKGVHVLAGFIITKPATPTGRAPCRPADSDGILRDAGAPAM
jgi:hypothetical protein